MNIDNNSEKNRIQELRASIRLKCFDCSMGEYREVENCRVKDCLIYHVRPTVDYGTVEEMEACIRAYCRDCIGDSPGRAQGCPSKDCPFHRFRIRTRKLNTGIKID